MDIKNLFKQVTGIFLACGTLFLPSVVLAEPFNSCAQNDCCFGDNTIQPPVCGYGYNPSAYLQCGNNQCCKAMDNVSASFDIVYWRPCSEGLQLGTDETFTNSNIGSANLVTTNESHAVDPKFKFDTGFRFGLGYNCQDHCWDVSLNWTHFHSKASAYGGKAKAFQPGNPTLPYTVFVSDWERLQGEFPTTITSRWSLDMDILDLEFAQRYYVNHCFALRPFFGLRAARIDQSYRVNSAQVATDVSSPPPTDYAATVKSTSNFRGIGPRAGLDMQIKLGCGLSIVGGAAGSLVFGTFDRHATETFTSSGAGPAELNALDSGLPQTFNYDASSGGPDRNSVAMVDMAIGVMWEHCFDCCGSSHPFALAFTWEQHAYYNLNNFNFAADGVSSSAPVVNTNSLSFGKTGDLSVQGLTVSAMIGF